MTEQMKMEIIGDRPPFSLIHEIVVGSGLESCARRFFEEKLRESGEFYSDSLVNKSMQMNKRRDNL